MIEIDAIVMIWSNKTSKFDLNLSLQKIYRLCKKMYRRFSSARSDLWTLNSEVSLLFRILKTDLRPILCNF